MKKLVVSMLASIALVGIVGCSTTTAKEVKRLDYSDPAFKDYDNPAVKTVIGENGVVSSQSLEASKAGIEVLKSGGNAFEAIAAASLTISVTNPWLSGFGGGGFMVGYDASKKEAVSYDFREFAPMKATDSSYTTSSKFNSKASGIPGYASGIETIIKNHGANFGLKEIVKPAQRVAEEGFKLESDHTSNFYGNTGGYALMADSAGITEANLLFTKMVDGVRRKLAVGDTYKNPMLGRTLKMFGEEGAKAIYEGVNGQAIIDASRFKSRTIPNGSDGKPLSVDDKLLESGESISTVLEYTGEDLGYGKGVGYVFTESDMYSATKDNAARKREPISGTYQLGKYKILSMPPASSGGINVIQQLNFLETLLSKDKPTLKDVFGTRNNPNLIHAMGLAQQMAYADRYQYVADMDKVYVPIEGLTSKEYAKDRFSKYYKQATPANMNVALTLNRLKGEEQYGNPCAIPAGQTKSYQELNGGQACPTGFYVDIPAGSPEGGGTTSISVADKHGNIATLTQTVNSFWGNGVFPKGLGFPLNNEMNDFAGLGEVVNGTNGITVGDKPTRPRTENEYKLLAGAVQPGKRPLSSMTPTIVLEKDGNGWKAKMSAGASGSQRIIAAVSQNIINVLDFGMTATEANEYEKIYNFTEDIPTLTKDGKKQLDYEGKTTAYTKVIRNQLSEDLIPFPGGNADVKKTSMKWIEDMGYGTYQRGGIGTHQSIRYYQEGGKLKLEGVAHYANNSNKAFGW